MRVVLDLERGQGAIAGSIGDGLQEAQTFSGWLDFVRLLDAARKPASGERTTDTSEPPATGGSRQER